MRHKFRAWDKVEKKMCIVERLNFDEGGVLTHVGVDFAGTDIAYVKVEFFDLMQFTGLTSKNGKDIFDGDVVEYVGRLHGVRKSKYKVIWGQKKCGFLLEMTEWPYDRKNMQPGRHLVVIGNIYENPELLEVQNGC